MKKTTIEKAFFILVLIIITILGFSIRYFLRKVQTSDFVNCFNFWYETIRKLGWRSISGEFSSYPPPYIYLLYSVKRALPWLSNVEAVKLPSILADFANALLGLGIIYSINKSRIQSMLCFAALFFAPTLFINSAYWGQTDSIYTCGILASVLCLLKKKSALSLFAFGIAFSIKLQALFIAPFVLALAVIGYFSWKDVMAFPLSVVLAYLPAYLAGRPIQDLLSIYLSQTNIFNYLTMNAASAYAWFANADYETVAPAGVLLAAGVCLLYIALVFYRKNTNLQSRDLILLITVSSVMVPFFLPNMHERYFYLLDIFSILLLFCFPKLFYIPVIAQLTSFFAYQPYLFAKELLPLSILAFGTLIILVVLSREMILRLYPTNTNYGDKPAAVS
jgi:Gpi18-like mannosyltransferase